MKVKLGSIEIHYTVEGQGPWLTMSHSLCCDSSMWDRQAALLAKDFTVLRFDTRGHGQSSAPEGAYTFDDLVSDVHGLYQHLGVKHSHWLGLSMGGMIGQAYALAHPGVFTSMVLADTTSRYGTNAAQMWVDRIRLAKSQGMEAMVNGTLERWFTPAYRESQPEVMARISRLIASTPVAGYAGCGAAIGTIDYADRLAEIRCPVLVIVGDQDPATPPEMAELMHARLPDSRLVVIPKASHIANIEQEERFNQALLDFYRTLE
jgi:3-oxoadipate enol-lactonase